MAMLLDMTELKFMADILNLVLQKAYLEILISLLNKSMNLDLQVL